LQEQFFFWLVKPELEIALISVASSFTSTLVGMAIADGKIENDNQPVIR
jgi:hypothetical protein